MNRSYKNTIDCHFIFTNAAYKFSGTTYYVISSSGVHLSFNTWELAAVNPGYKKVLAVL